MIEIIWLKSGDVDYLNESHIFDTESKKEIKTHQYLWNGDLYPAKYFTDPKLDDLLSGTIDIVYPKKPQYSGIYIGKMELRVENGRVIGAAWHGEDDDLDETLQVSYSEEVGIDEISGTEGEVKLISHFRIERNSKIVRKLKMAAGKFPKCKICETDMRATYDSDLCEKYIEAHHLSPLGLNPGKRVSKPTDFVLICSNCHRMVHKYIGTEDKSKNKWTVKELKIGILSKDIS